AILAVELGDGISPEGFDAIVERHGGTVRELLSDEAIAVFAGHDDDVLRALRAGVELRESISGVRVVVDRVSAGDIAAVRELLRSVDAQNVVLGADALAVVPAAVDVVPHESGAFRVLRFDPEAEPFARRYDTPLIGRGEELALLVTAVDELASARAAGPRPLVGR